MERKPEKIDDAHLESLRERLYERGVKDEHRGHTSYTPPPAPNIDSQWHDKVHVPPPIAAPTPVIPVTDPLLASMKMKKRTRVRMMALAGGGIFFTLAMALSATFFFFGGKSISGENITLDVKGPLSVGGGEELPLTISVTNQNTVPIESATLVIEYPYGTQSVADSGKEMFRERQTIDHVNPGQTINIQTSALVFGEENEEKEAKVSIDYRVQGSNAIFYKDASPLRFKISSSPVVLTVDSVKQTSSGQDVDFTLTIGSNSPTPLSDLLVVAEYPDGFTWKSAEPKPTAGQASWRIATLKPNEKKTIKIKGMIAGKAADERSFKFTVGVPNDSSKSELASTFSAKTQVIKIEQAFVAVGATINGSKSETAVVGMNGAATVNIDFANSIGETLYDGEIIATLSGNALDKTQVNAGQGFYNSSENTITWDSHSMPSLEEIAPGKSVSVSFNFTPNVVAANSQTPAVEFVINVKGKRVREADVAQELIGTVSRVVKVESQVGISAYGVFSYGPFANTGPVPPVAEQPTQYGIVLSVQNGSNASKDATVETTLPPYVSWQNLSQASAGTLKYNASSRVVTWSIGDLEANAAAAAAFQITLLPSVSQVGSMPALIGGTRYSATDKFTGTTLRATAPDVTTELANDPRPDAQEGRVLPLGTQ